MTEPARPPPEIRRLLRLVGASWATWFENGVQNAAQWKKGAASPGRKARQPDKPDVAPDSPPHEPHSPDESDYGPVEQPGQAPDERGNPSVEGPELR